MFRSFFLSRHWALWAWPGAVLIFGGTWYQVQIDVKINDWFGGFYDVVQKALSQPGAVSIEEFFGFLLSFGELAGVDTIEKSQRSACVWASRACTCLRSDFIRLAGNRSTSINWYKAAGS